MFKKIVYFMVVLGLGIAAAALADVTTATRVTITTSGGLPDPELLVEPLFTGSDPNRAVRMERHAAGTTTTLQIDLWGTTISQADIPNVLRLRFPELSSAGITTSTIEAPRPAIDDGGVPAGTRIIHKEIRTSP